MIHGNELIGLKGELNGRDAAKSGSVCSEDISIKLGVFLRGLNVVKVSSPLQVSALILANYPSSCLINVTHRLSLGKLPGAVAVRPPAVSCS